MTCHLFDMPWDFLTLPGTPHLPGQTFEKSGSMGSIKGPRPKAEPSTSTQPLFFLSWCRIHFGNTMKKQFYLQICREMSRTHSPGIESASSPNTHSPSLVVRNLRSIAAPGAQNWRKPRRCNLPDLQELSNVVKTIINHPPKSP